MKFMMLVIPKGYEQAARGTMPPADAVDKMMKYNESPPESRSAAGAGWTPSAVDGRASIVRGREAATDGPFAEAKEVIGGYWMIQVKSREEAIEWAKRCPMSDNEIIEVRQVQEMA